MHLDTLLRLAAATFADSTHRFASAVLAGEKISDLLATDGMRMTDQELVKRVAKANPWIKRVYKETSGYIHLSRKHVSNTVREKIGGGGLQIVMGKEDDVIPDQVRLEACGAMDHITLLILHYLESWRATKDA